MGWWQEAKTGAAREFGARHYRMFAALAVARRVAPALGVLALTALLIGGGWAAWYWLNRPVPKLPMATLALPAASLVALILLGVITAVAVRRWGLYLRLYSPVEHAAVWLWCLVMLAGGAIATVVWLHSL